MHSCWVRVTHLVPVCAASCVTMLIIQTLAAHCTANTTNVTTGELIPGMGNCSCLFRVAFQLGSAFLLRLFYFLLLVWNILFNPIFLEENIFPNKYITKIHISPWEENVAIIGLDILKTIINTLKRHRDQLRNAWSFKHVFFANPNTDTSRD